MPELPEVETIRRQLAPRLEGRLLEEVEVLDARWCEPAHPSELADALGDGGSRSSAGAASTSWWRSRTRSSW